MTVRSVIKGVGSALPERRIDNEELAETVDTTDAWIVERTGIRSRYVAGEGDFPALGEAAEARLRRFIDLGGLIVFDCADGGSDRFIDAMVLHGDAEAIRRGLRAHFDAGATHLCIQPVHEDGDLTARDRTLATLADT